MTKLTEGEREVWKDLYRIHEKYHDMGGTPEEWYAMAQEVGTLSGRYEGKEKRLMAALLFALYDWFSDEQKLAEEARRTAPEQITMEGVAIPWT